MINIPTLQQLYTDNLVSIEAEFNINIPLFGKNFLRALAAVQAGKQWVTYKAIALTQKNIFADTADPESMGGTLERFGRVKLGRNPFAATSGEYSVQLTGTIGAVVDSGTTFKSNDDSASPGLLFVLDVQFILDGIDIVVLRALTPGLDSRLLIADKLTLTAPIALVDSECIVLTESVIPESEETIADYRKKVLEAFRLEPQGGSGSDYRIWSADAQGVLNSYPYATPGFTNQVDLYIEATILDSIDGKGTPTALILSDVQDAIELPTIDRPSRKPITVIVNYLPITVIDIDIKIASFVGLNPTIESLILSAIKTELDTIRPFVSSIDVLSNKNDIFDINKIISLVLVANPGSVFGAVELKADLIVVPSIQFVNGQIPFLNSITYV